MWRFWSYSSPVELKCAQYLQLAPLLPQELDQSGTKLWHLTCTSKYSYVIQVPGISKGHNLSLFIWCTGCQCFCVQHEFSRGRCQRSGPCKGSRRGWLVPSITSQQVLCDLCCLSRSSWFSWAGPYGLSNKLQNYCANELVVKCAGAQQLLRLQKKKTMSDSLVCLANKDKSWTLQYT